MDEIELYKKLGSATTIDMVKDILEQAEQGYGERLKWAPVGSQAQENNRGIIEICSDPGKALIERITNGIDAIMELEYQRRYIPGGVNECASPREAAQKWLDIPPTGVGGLEIKRRGEIADRVVVTIAKGDNPALYTVSIRDLGIGITPELFPHTILSLNRSNKWKSNHLMGSYGQGGSCTFATAVSKYTLIISRERDSQRIGYTIVKYQEAAAGNKTGNYVYLTIDEKIPEVSLPFVDEFACGTQATHFGYDLHKHKGFEGSRSVYGLLNRALFDPIIPIRMVDENYTHEGRVYDKTIPGSRAMLNGNLPESTSGRGKLLGGILHHEHQIKKVGEHGSISIEYWVIGKSPKNTNPVDRYVEIAKPIILTEHGQTRGEMPQSVISKGNKGSAEGAQLTYLDSQIVVQIDCDSLTTKAKGDLFVSNRESMRRGAIYEMIRSTLVQALKADEELSRLNREAKENIMQSTDEELRKKMRKRIARILTVKLGSSDRVQITTASGSGDDRRPPRDHTVRPPKKHETPPPIEPQDPPTYIKLLYGDESDAIQFHAGEQRYVRVETDAGIAYCNPTAKQNSLNTIPIPATAVEHVGYTELKDGRFKLIMRARPDANVGDTGTIRIELSIRGRPTLFSEKPYIVTAPPAKTAKHTIVLPNYNVIPVAGPEDPNWAMLGWPEDVTSVASENREDSDELNIYFSTVYPPYLSELSAVERKDAKMVKAFQDEYSVWTGVYSLLIYIDQKTKKNENENASAEPCDDEPDTTERVERCRAAKFIAMQVTNIIQGEKLTDDEEL
jgi:ribosomal protein L29